MKPLGACVDRRAFYVAPIMVLADAQAFIAAHHYARGSSRTAVAAHGLYAVHDSTLLGVALWLPPTSAAAKSVYHVPREVLSLSRLAVVPGLPKNTSGFFVAQSIRVLRVTDPRWGCLLTYADTAQGHTGTIYRATNWEYLGLTPPQAVWVDAEGRQVSRKVCRTTYSMGDMRARGATLLGKFPRHKFRMVLR